MASLINYRDKYHISYYVNGKRKLTNTKLDFTKNNLSKARKIKTEIEERIEIVFKNTEMKYDNLISKDKNISISDAAFICQEERIKGKSPSHFRNFNIVMKHFYKIIPPGTFIGDINSGHINSFINQISPEVANASMHTYIRYIKILFNYLVEEDYLFRSPVKKKLIPKVTRSNIVTFDNSVLEDILQIAKERDLKFYNCLMMLLLTGLRPIDLLKLRVSDFDFERKQINVRISKTSKEIKFPIFEELEKFINENMESDFEKNRDEFLFDGFNVDVIGKRFRRIKKLLNLNDKYVITLKTFRKTFATGMAGRGLSIQEVANLLGHDSTTTTEKYYADVITESLRKKINSLNYE